MGSRWNVDGPLSMSEIPPEFAEFTKQKQTQLLSNVLTSAALGVIVANAAALVGGDATLALLATTAKAQVPLFVLAAVYSALRK